MLLVDTPRRAGIDKLVELMQNFIRPVPARKSFVNFLNEFTFFCCNVGYNSLSQGRVTYIFLITKKLLGICGLSQFWYTEAQEHNDLQ